MHHVAIGDASLKCSEFYDIITFCECYPKNKEIEELFDQKYCRLSGEELTDIVVKEDF